jgi:hypothetical protein
VGNIFAKNYVIPVLAKNATFFPQKSSPVPAAPVLFPVQENLVRILFPLAITLATR